MSAGLAYQGAASNRLFGDWNALDLEVNDEYFQDGQTLAQRAWDLYRNDPYARAMVETVVGGTLGPKGLEFRSLYQADEKSDTSDEEKDVRRVIESAIKRATTKNRFDASGRLSFRDMCVAMIVTRRVGGNAWAIRLNKPHRNDAFQSTCWRLIDPSRVSNPNGVAASDRMFEGVEMDSDGNPVAIHVRSSHPNIQRQSSGKVTWLRIPFYGSTGELNVVHHRRVSRADQILGVSEFAPNIRIVKYLADITWFWVVAKKMQAANCIIIECDDPTAAANADRNGALLAGAVGIKPGMKYYVPTGWKMQFMNANFQGADYKDFRNSQLEAACSPWCLPYEFVLHTLTGTNLSASRAALLQFYNTMQREQDEFVTQVLLPWHQSIIAEEVAMGRLKVPTDDMDLISKCRYLRPPRVWPDPKKEADAARAWIDMGRSISSVYGEIGYAFEDEIAQRAQDNAYMESQGVSIAEESIGERIITEPKEKTDAEGRGIEGDDETKPGEEAKP